MCLTENSTLECVGSSCQVVVSIAVVAIASSFATLIGHLLSALYAGARNMPRPATDVVQFLANSTAKAKAVFRTACRCRSRCRLLKVRDWGVVAHGGVDDATKSKEAQ